MADPQKPFACAIPDCGMTFTNEDHLHVHTKKHDMILQLGSAEQRQAFVADQTPTPTRFIRNCEEVGLFQDLQNVNPFDEGFKRAMESKTGIPILDSSMAMSDDSLHTPQMVFPVIADGDATLYTACNNQRNITISRSSSDESGAIREFETTTISKLTNEVTTISRIIEKSDGVVINDDVAAKHDDITKETSVSYTNNIIKVHSNLEIRKDHVNIENKPITIIAYADTSKNDDNLVAKEVMLMNNLTVPDVPPIMSQKSLDSVVDSLTCDNINDKIDKTQPKVKRNSQRKRSAPTLDKVTKNVKTTQKDDTKTDDDFAVLIKLPNRGYVKMKAVEHVDAPDCSSIKLDTKEKLKQTLLKKADKQETTANVIPIPTGTLIPITLINSTPILLTNSLHKVPIAKDSTFLKSNDIGKLFKPRKRKSVEIDTKTVENCKTVEHGRSKDQDWAAGDACDNVREREGAIGDKIREEESNNVDRDDKNNLLERRSAASKRYRERLKTTMASQTQENRKLREINKKLLNENSLLKIFIRGHLSKCSNAKDFDEIKVFFGQNSENL